MRRQIGLAVVAALTAAACSKPPPGICEPLPRFDGRLPPADATQAFDWAAACIHRQAYALAKAEGDLETIAQATIGGCLAVVQAAQARSYFGAAASLSPVLPPEGYLLFDETPAAEGAPRCRSGAEVCKPWERDWSGLPEQQPGEAETAAAKQRDALGVAASERTLRDLTRIARFRVVQARAGKCHTLKEDKQALQP